jgi:hypothetical protein
MVVEEEEEEEGLDAVQYLILPCIVFYGYVLL